MTRWMHFAGVITGARRSVTEQVLKANPGLAEYGPLFTSRAAGGAAGHSDNHHRADRPAMGLNYDA